MKKLAILGLGHIGKYVYNTLSGDRNFAVVEGHDTTTGVDLSNPANLKEIVGRVDGVLASTPYFLNKAIAAACAEAGTDYFDLTESVDVTNYVKGLGGSSKFVTQCGLAPGMVSIIANRLAREFLDAGGKVDTIQIRVGALPQNSTNKLGYYRTWNTEGLINEYIHPCPAIVSGVQTTLQPLGDRETVTIGGKTLEAANTSGGIGSLPETYSGFAGGAWNVNYKTLRYPGHWDYVQFLRDDLGLHEEFSTYVDLFNKYVPVTADDVVYILINVHGYTAAGAYTTKQYCKEVYSIGDTTAIQITTASGVMAVLDAWSTGALDRHRGLVKQEELDYGSVWGSKYSDPYK